MGRPGRSERQLDIMAKSGKEMCFICKNGASRQTHSLGSLLQRLLQQSASSSLAASARTKQKAFFVYEHEDQHRTATGPFFSSFVFL